MKKGDKVRVKKEIIGHLECWVQKMDFYKGQEFVIDRLTLQYPSYPGNWFRLKGNTWDFHESWLELIEPEIRLPEITYRQWLVGIVAGGPVASTFNLHDVQGNARHVIKFADEIIKQIEDES